MVRKLVNICAGAESATSLGQNYRPNLVFFLDLIQRLSDRIDQLIVESIQLSRTFKRKNGHRFTIAAGENIGIHNDLNWRSVQLPVNPPGINPRTETQPRMDPPSPSLRRAGLRMNANSGAGRRFIRLYHPPPETWSYPL